MPANTEDRAFLKELYNRLSDKPLEPGNRFYEPVYANSDGNDPVAPMRDHIEFSETESIQEFSGYTGTGKTTELFRLKRDLEDLGYFVVYANAEDYINPTEPIEVSDLLIVLAGAFSDAIRPETNADFAQESFWGRIKNFFNTDVTFKELGVKFGDVDLKFELKTGSTFRQKIQKLLAGRLRDVKAQTDSFFEDGVKFIRSQHGKDKRIVFILDQLEKMRGSLTSEEDVIRSVERIFLIHFETLKLPYIHAVYTVPPWLKFRSAKLGASGDRLTILPAVHLWKNDPERSRDEACWTIFRSLIHRRLGDEGLRRLFGAPSGGEHILVDRIIDMCGGHFRDVLFLLRETVLRAAGQSSLPVERPLVEHVINRARSDFLPIALEDAKWLTEIARIRSTALPSTEVGPVNRLSHFINSHSVLYFANSTEWYDVHPLIRNEIEEVMRAIGQPSA